MTAPTAAPRAKATMTDEEREDYRRYHRIKSREYYRRNLEKCREKSRRYGRKKREKFADALREYNRAWRAKRKAREKGAEQ